MPSHTLTIVVEKRNTEKDRIILRMKYTWTDGFGRDHTLEEFFNPDESPEDAIFSDGYRRLMAQIDTKVRQLVIQQVD